MAVTYKDINELTQKAAVAGTEKLPVSDTEYITPAQMYYPGNANRSDVDWEAKNLSVSGKAGVGTSSPGQTFSVLSTAGEVAGFESSSTYSCLVFKASGGYNWSVGRNATSFYFWNSKSNTIVTSISNEGNIVASGTITPGSDTRIKDDQREIGPDDAIAVIERLTPKTWTFNEKAGNPGKKAAGLVAQEVAEVIPEAVLVSKIGGFDDFHSLNYNTIQGYELAAIKGLIAKINALRAEIEELKNKK